MLNNLKITISEIINAPPSAVWRAITDKELIKQYFFGTEVESDWKKGSSITFSGEWEGQKYKDQGTILDIEKEKLLRFSYWSSMSGLEDTPENYATVTYRFEPVETGTKLIITQQGFKDREAYQHSEQGWKEVLRSLKTVVEG